jgi:hypothetical protein
VREEESRAGQPIDWSVNQCATRISESNPADSGSSPALRDAAHRPNLGFVLPIALSLSTGEVILIVVFTTIPIALLTFALGAKNALDEVGKGQFAVEFESDTPSKITDSDADRSPAAREDEIRQLLEAKSYRQQERGEAPLDVDAELRRLLSEKPSHPTGVDPRLAEEVRQLVVARNERRARQGKEPLDVEQEVDRQLRELENLGQ